MRWVGLHTILGRIWVDGPHRLLVDPGYISQLSQTTSGRTEATFGFKTGRVLANWGVGPKKPTQRKTASILKVPVIDSEYRCPG